MVTLASVVAVGAAEFPIVTPAETGRTATIARSKRTRTVSPKENCFFIMEFFDGEK
jgi:hypothetical protein